MYVQALYEGLIWSALWIGYVYMIIKLFPWTMLHDYPEDIQKASKIPKPTLKQQRSSYIWSSIGGLIILLSLIAFGLQAFKDEKVSLLTLFIYIFIIVMSWNVIDLIIMDWLIVCTITPDWIVIKGTKGCKGYKDYMFHFKGFLIGCIYTTITALLFSGVDYIILKYLIWK
ncbi:hypothetical protein BCR32DRAFT_271910 [Anaeromyces robustus]|uniref:Uncharacterized protein n=1 Tax=Anaeromyces robustus TaxID=1754192 RepID=A0A1Y1WQ59_9FUNG|nr:hypothetical protein BCR32DRAFT_271910 [Anaeromyces robustus]|eukprot:ORX75428.1 hypothetical protein BCR32DRAFT_271910 [Anaeromyces robustus]